MREDILLTTAYDCDYDEYGSPIEGSKRLVVDYGIGAKTGKVYILEDCDWKDKESKLGAKYDRYYHGWYIEK